MVLTRSDPAIGDSAGLLDSFLKDFPYGKGNQSLVRRRFDRGRWGWKRTFRGNRVGAAGGGGEDSLPLGKVLGSRETGSVLEAPERCEGKLNLCLLLAA